MGGQSFAPAPPPPSWLRRLWPGRFRAEGPLRVALGTTRPGQGTLSLQFLDSPVPVFRAGQRREERDEVVDVALRQRQRLDVLVEPGIFQAIALVVVVHDVPKGFLRAVVKVGPG